MSCQGDAVKKSCVHTMERSFQRQVNRLQEAGFHASITTSVCRSLLKKIKSGDTEKKRERPRNFTVLPYVHRLSHRLKKVAQRHEVDVVFSASQKLSKLRRKVNLTRKKPCGKKHDNVFVECQVGIVYRIPLTCGKVYVGQSGRCINDRLREHAASLRASPSGHLSVHRRGCQPTPNNTLIIGRYADRQAREILEAHAIMQLGDTCISAPSLALSRREVTYLDSFPVIG